MDKQRIEELVAKYNEGLADPVEIRTLEQMIEDGLVPLTDLRVLTTLDDQLMKAVEPSPSLNLDDKFYQMLSSEKKKLNRGFGFEIPSLSVLFPRLALAASILILGFIGGYLFRQPSSSPELVKEVSDLKEMMMLSLLEKESATDRLKAVGLTNEMDQASDKVVRALFQTLNSDENVNVRLAALDALRPYVRQSNVREELIRSIAAQESPLVQISLADLMVQIQEKKSVTELQKIIDNEKTPKEVKGRIKKSIDVLI